MLRESERTEPCACDETWGFFSRGGKSYAQCRKCGGYWQFVVSGHPEHPPVEGGYRGAQSVDEGPPFRGAEHGKHPCPYGTCPEGQHPAGHFGECYGPVGATAANPAFRSSVIAEAMLADAVRVEAPKTTSKLSVPPLEYLFAEWCRRRGNTLPLDSAERKAIPLHGGCNAYFPAALAAVAAWSYFNNQKHNPGKSLHWSQDKSGDHAECLARHGVDVGDARVAGDVFAEFVESTAEAWRALGKLQMLAQRLGAPDAPGSKRK